MEVSNEAKRIMVVALGKLYSSRTQRGGLRLHRSLLLTLVMKSARDMYHAAQTTAESTEQQHLHLLHHHQQQQQQAPAEVTAETSPREEEKEEEEEVVVVVAGSPSENKENQRPESGPAQLSRKRRGKAAAEPDFLPRKKAKLERVNRPHAQPHAQLVVSAVLMDYVNCGSELGAPPAAPMPLQRAIAAC